MKNWKTEQPENRRPQKLISVQHRDKQLKHKLKRLTQSERARRLYICDGMLKTFLCEPTLLTFLFHSEAAQKKLDKLIEKRRKTLTTGDSKNLLF